MLVVDLDGTILDGRERHYACYKNILTFFGARPLDIGEYWTLKRARRSRRELLTRSGVEPRYSEFMDRWLATIESPEMLALDRVRPGGHAALKELRARAGELVLVTSRKDEAALMAQLESTQLASAIDHVVCATGADTGVTKAAALQNRAEIRGACGGWIGDTEVDIEAARVLGVPSLVVASGLRTREYLLTHLPDFLYANLEELTKLHEWQAR